VTDISFAKERNGKGGQRAEIEIRLFPVGGRFTPDVKEKRRQEKEGGEQVGPPGHPGNRFGVNRVGREKQRAE